MNCNDINSAWDIWKNKFNDACDEHAPVKEKLVKGYLPEWIDSDFIKLSKHRDYWYSKAHKTNDPMDWEKARSLRNKVWARSQGVCRGAMHPPKCANRSTFSHKVGQKLGFCRRVRGCCSKKCTFLGFCTPQNRSWLQA